MMKKEFKDINATLVKEDFARKGFLLDIDFPLNNPRCFISLFSADFNKRCYCELEEI
jgi:hypothetical protein